MTIHPEFRLGAKNRRAGLSKTQSQKHLGRGYHDDRMENRNGWEAMEIFLLLQDVDDDATMEDIAVGNLPMGGDSPA